MVQILGLWGTISKNERSLKLDLKIAMKGVWYEFYIREVKSVQIKYNYFVRTPNPIQSLGASMSLDLSLIHI